MQHAVMQTIKRHEGILQVHGFYYFDDERRISVDVVPAVSVKDEALLQQQLTSELQALYPDEHITVLIDHNYS